jgi:glutamate N-acetyltransferase/amino-acid N-acetyltransferase
MSVCVPAGFQLAGIHCGIKPDASREDLTLIYAERPAVAAAVYTQNVVVAAPVVVDRPRTPCANLRAVVVNSGNANACTGARGLQDARDMARLAAEACGAADGQSLVMSTGVIGTYLPMPKITAGIPVAAAKLGTNAESLLSAARGITTTDKSHKVAGRVAGLPAGDAQITGIAKGAGMIGPNMATMLCILMTDAALQPLTAQRMLQAAVDESFNCISVEGHTSTNDTVLLLASGKAHGRPLGETDLPALQLTLNEVCIELATMIPDDGEGASHLIAIEVRGCATREDAQRIARTVANSNLVKTGIAGADPNWGRIVSAAGYAGVEFDPDGLSLSLNGTCVFRQGGPVDFDAHSVSESIRCQRETRVELTFREGSASARFWTSDLTDAYVRFNADYTT